MLVYDVSDLCSFDDIKDWLNEIHLCYNVSRDVLHLSG